MSPRGALATEMRERSRTALLATARRLFAEKGFRGTSMADLARAAGVSKGLAYSYFDNKEAILEELIAERWQDLQEEMDQAGTIEEPAARLRFFLRRSLDRAARDPATARLWLSVLLQPDAVETLARSKRRQRARIERYLELLEQAFSALGSRDSRADVLLWSALINGLIFNRVTLGSSVAPNSVEARVLALFGAGGPLEGR